MKLPKLTKPQLIQNIQDINADLYERILEIEAHPESALQFSPKRYREKITSLNIDFNDLNKYEEKELEHLRRELTIIEQMKTSTLEGAEAAKVNWQPIYTKAQEMGEEETFDKLNTIMSKLYEKSYVFYEYRYEIMKVAEEKIEQGQSADYIVDIIDNIYRRATKDSQFQTEEEVHRMFYKGLKYYRARGKK